MEPMLLTDIFNEIKLYEGLEKTHDIWTTIYHLEKWPIASDKFTVYQHLNNTIQLKFSDNLTEKEFNNLLQLINSLGWFIAVYLVNDSPFKYKKFDKDSYIKNDIDKSLMVFILEAKFDLELNKMELNILYHTTPAIYKDDILQIGLKPFTKEKQSYHPDRIYLCKTLDKCKLIRAKLYTDSTEQMIFSVDVTGFIKYNTKAKFYQDPQFDGGIYTLSNIHPKFLKIIEEKD